MSEEFTVSPARYAKGMMIVRCPSTTGFKTRAARLIGDALKCRWSGRCGGYVASPAKVAKFERLYAAGWDACFMTGALDHQDWRYRGMTVGQALRTAAPALPRANVEAVEVSTEVSTKPQTKALPPYPKARELAGPSKLLTPNYREKRRKATLLALKLRRSLAHEYAFVETLRAKQRERSDEAAFKIADLEQQLAAAIARAEKAEAATAPALDKATARIVALETELQRLRPPVRMPGVAVHALMYGARGRDLHSKGRLS